MLPGPQSQRPPHTIKNKLMDVEEHTESRKPIRWGVLFEGRLGEKDETIV
jgi:hypothetical protein